MLRIVTEDENSEAGEESQEQDGSKTGVKVVVVQCQNTPTYIIIIKISSFLHIYAWIPSPTPGRVPDGD